MSIIFIPKAETLKKYQITDNVKKARRAEPRKWTDEEINVIINLRAVNCTFDVIAKILNRPKQSCSHIVFSRKLYDAIADKKQKMVNEIMGS